MRRRLRRGRGARPLRGGARSLLLLGAALAAGAPLACAGGERPWDVDPRRQPRFEETRRTCHLLTDGEEGAVRPERFDACMARRGFHRKPWWKFWN